MRSQSRIVVVDFKVVQVAKLGFPLDFNALSCQRIERLAVPGTPQLSPASLEMVQHRIERLEKVFLGLLGF